MYKQSPCQAARDNHRVPVSQRQAYTQVAHVPVIKSYLYVNVYHMYLAYVCIYRTQLKKILPTQQAWPVTVAYKEIT